LLEVDFRGAGRALLRLDAALFFAGRAVERLRAAFFDREPALARDLFLLATGYLHPSRRCRRKPRAQCIAGFAFRNLFRGKEVPQSVRPMGDADSLAQE
jgi:hypothetical protein